MENKETVKQEIKELLIKMHKGESLLITLQAIIDIIGGINYIQERKFIYLLQGIHQDKITATPTKEEDINYLNGHTDAVDENNFAVKLAVSVILGVDDVDK